MYSGLVILWDCTARTGIKNRRIRMDFRMVISGCVLKFQVNIIFLPGIAAKIVLLKKKSDHDPTGNKDIVQRICRDGRASGGIYRVGGRGPEDF
jgi:hypothetical protein